MPHGRKSNNEIKREIMTLVYFHPPELASLAGWTNIKAFIFHSHHLSDFRESRFNVIFELVGFENYIFFHGVTSIGFFFFLWFKFHL